MTEERVTYTTQLEARIAELEAELTGVIEGHTAATELTAKIDLAKDRMIAVRDARIAELTDTIERKNGALHALDGIAKQLAETVQRLEVDNRRLRHLDAMPVDAMERYHAYTHYDVHAANDAGYTTQQFDSDDVAIGAWFEGRTVTHD